MRGLMLKDFYAIKDALLIPLLLMVVIGIVLSVVSSPWLLIVIAGTSFGMMAVMSIQSDKTAQWDKFCATLPVSRIQSASSKYGLYVLLSLFGILIATIICVIASMILSSFELSAVYVNVSFAFILAFLPASVNIPSSFLLDGEKSIAGIILSYVVTALAIAGLRTLLGYYMNIEENLLLLYGVVAAFSVVVYILSWIICPRWLSRKEL
ncbi:ABC-2 transporter permease [Paenibacillus sp. FSL k6-2145]|uniref:ABC-2 transporter permease n=1 Tax=Paenibacillus sp. FSL k6-2145 TaxID=2976834 RepID=UPI0030D99334